MAWTQERWGTRTTLIGALTVMAVTLALDVVLGPTWVFTPVLIAGPLIAAASGPPRVPLLVGMAATGLAVWLGWANDLVGTRRHIVAAVTVGVGTIMGVALAVVRRRREEQVARSRPHVDQAIRLVRAMHAGNMGEWTWTKAADRVVFDAAVAKLFGVTAADGDTTGEIDTLTWVDLVDERDRASMMSELQAGLASRRTFRFDHRCRWPDGSVHWLEVLGEPVYSEGELVAVQGLVWNVDERYQQLEERARLLDIEHVGRVRAEYLARVHDVFSRSVDPVEILEKVTRAAVPDLADWCSAVLVIDQPREQPVIVAAHSDEHLRHWAQEVLERFPYDPDAAFGSAQVVRTGVREVRQDLAQLFSLVSPSQRDVLEKADIDAVATLPIYGQLGLLGTLQLIRGRGRPAFSATDLELAEELASRCGAALNSAVVLARQRTATEALETLQRVSEWMSRAVTRYDVAIATVTHGAHGLQADVGVVYVIDDGEELIPLARAGDRHSADASMEARLRELVRQALREDRQVVTELSRDDLRTVLVTPMRIVGRLSGATVFAFKRPRRLEQSELAMAVTLTLRCAGALERASYYERERETALILQRRLLPQVPAIPPWAEVGFRYEPAAGGQVGGDWFQLINIDDAEVVAVVGDAVGHGITAAAAMGQLRSSIATAVSFDRDPAAVLRNVDRFASTAAETLAATAVVTSLERNGSCRLATAGHPPPIIVRADTSQALVEEGRRPLLGFGDGSITGPSYRTALTEGDLLVLYSDGLVERRGEVIDAGIGRLRALVGVVQHLPAQHACDEVVDRLGKDLEAEDDVALVVVRYTGDS